MSTKTCKVRLLAGRTGYGHRGDVVDGYPLDEAELHESRGTVQIISVTKPKAKAAPDDASDDDKPKPKAKPKANAGDDDKPKPKPKPKAPRKKAPQA